MFQCGHISQKIKKGKGDRGRRKIKVATLNATNSDIIKWESADFPHKPTLGSHRAQITLHRQCLGYNICLLNGILAAS